MENGNVDTPEGIRPPDPAPAAPQGPAAAAQAAGGCCACPLSRIPESFWLSLVPRPFRKRHPVIFWGLVVVLVLVVLGLVGLAGSDDESEPDEDCLAVVTIKGPIFDTSKELVWIDALGHKEKVKGVLLRVDSPGGGAAASQELYVALAGLAAKKPIAVSMGSVAASGGLMVSMAGHRIFATGSTVTGSIGVRMDIPQVGRLLDRLGVGKQTLTTAPYKDAGSVLRELTPDERRYFEGVIADMHAQFVDIVAAGRHMDREKAAALANGQVMTGRAAVEAGLVDEIGGMDAARDWLCKETGVPADRKLLHRVDDDRVQEFIRKYLSTAVSVLSGAGMPDGPVFLYR